MLLLALGKEMLPPKLLAGFLLGVFCMWVISRPSNREQIHTKDSNSQQGRDLASCSANLTSRIECQRLQYPSYKPNCCNENIRLGKKFNFLDAWTSQLISAWKSISTGSKTQPVTQNKAVIISVDTASCEWEVQLSSTILIFQEKNPKDCCSNSSQTTFLFTAVKSVKK